MRVTVPHCKLSSGCIWSSGLPPLPGRRARQICGQKTSAAGRAGQWSAANLNLIKGSESSAMPASHIVRCLRVVQHSALQLHVTPGDVELRLAQSLPLPQSRPPRHLHSSNYAPIRYAAEWPCPAPRAAAPARHRVDYLRLPTTRGPASPAQPFKLARRRSAQDVCDDAVGAPGLTWAGHWQDSMRRMSVTVRWSP